METLRTGRVEGKKRWGGGGKGWRDRWMGVVVALVKVIWLDVVAAARSQRRIVFQFLICCLCFFNVF